MTPDVRAAYERALEDIAVPDPAFAVRFERWFGDVLGPLRAVYGNDERFADAFRALLRAVADAAAARPTELRGARHRPACARPRARDHPRLAAPRAGDRLRRVRRPLRRHARRRPRAPALPA